MRKLVQVEAPHYVAGFEVEDGIAVRVAPIIHWALFKSESYLREYFAHKRYRVTSVYL